MWIQNELPHVNATALSHDLTFLFYFHQLDLKVQLFSCHLMVRVESDHLLIFCGNRYRERLTALVCKVYLLADFQVLRTREICDLK